MADTKEEPLSVTEAVQVAKGQVAQIPTLSVMGEVSGFRGPNARSGHCYLGCHGGHVDHRLARCLP